MLSAPLEATLQVTDILEGLRIPYAVGGSLASSLYGEARSSLDADILADLQSVHMPPFLEQLGSSWYVAPEAIERAIRGRSSFNCILRPTMFKVDIFIPKERAFDRAQLARRCYHVFDENPRRGAYVASAEDTVLAKLEWYALGGQQASRQWRDVLGVLAVQAGNLDLDYLACGARELAISELLERALREVSGG